MSISEIAEGERKMPKYLCEWTKSGKGMTEAVDIDHAKNKMKCEECGRYKLGRINPLDAAPHLATVSNLVGNGNYGAGMISGGCSGPMKCASQ